MLPERNSFARKYRRSVRQYEARKSIIGEVVALETGENKFVEKRVELLADARLRLRNSYSK